MSQPIRILELRSVRGTGGGPEKTILLGAQRAAPNRFSVTACYIRDARDDVFAIGSWANRLGVDYVEVMERHSFDPMLWPALRQIVRQRGIDIVHAHDYKTNLLALMLAKTQGVIPIATAHGWTGDSRRERWLYYPLDKQVLRWFPMTIAVSGQIRLELIGAGVRPQRVRVIHNGIDHLAFQRDRSREIEARRALGLSGDDIVIGAAARLERQKRFDLLIQACAALQMKYPRLHLLLAGDGSLRTELEQLGDQMSPGSFRLLGHQSEIVSVHHALDVFVQSSDYEGTSNALLEAMALETPLVATAAGGTEEIVEHGTHGLIVPTGDVAALTTAIDRTLTERQETAACVRRARHRVEHELSFEARVRAVERVYEEAIENSARRSRALLADHSH